MVKETTKWSQSVTQNSHALVLEKGVFTWKNPKKIALSLMYSAKVSKNKKSSAKASAMSMLNFYINRAGKKLPENQKQTLNKAKDELKKLS